MGNNATIVSISTPSSVPARGQFTATFIVKNTGSTTWTPYDPASNPQGYDLGLLPQDTSPWGLQRVPLPGNVAPGATVTLTATLTAPANPLPASLGAQMVQEGVGWFGGTLTITVQVVGSLPPPPTDPNDLVSADLIQIAPYVGDNNSPNPTFHTVSWQNTTGKRLLIKKVYLWTGVDMGVLCDTHAQLTRHSDGSFLALNQWDHYAQPTAPQNGLYVDFDPYMVLAAGDALDLTYMTNLFNSQTAHAAHAAAVWALYG